MGFMYICFSLVAFSLFFYVMYSTKVDLFRNIGATLISTIRFAQGGFMDWYSLFQLQPIMWVIIMTIAFVTLTLVLNNLAAAIMLSHKKEKDLFEHYSYHP